MISSARANPPTSLQLIFVCPSELGEQYDQFAIRVKSEIAFLASEAESRNVLAVTHGGVIRTALTEVFGMTSDDAVRLSADYGAIVDLSALEARPL